MGSMRLLFLGDVVGKPGRRAVQALLPGLVSRERISFVVANCENIADGAGVDAAGVRFLLGAGVDVLTSGNHVWRLSEARALVEEEERLLRPANYPDGAPGRGCAVFESAEGVRIVVINLLGRIFMDPVDCPFHVVSALLARLGDGIPILVDMHAEATSEKAAMGWYLAGRVTAVVGSHTHVQTADERILPGGTAFLTDAGMCGPTESVIGARPTAVVERFVTRLPGGFPVASGPAVVQGVIVDLDCSTGKALAVRRVREVGQ